MKTVLHEPADDAAPPGWGAMVRIRYTCSVDGTVQDKQYAEDPLEFQLNTSRGSTMERRGVGCSTKI